MTRAEFKALDIGDIVQHRGGGPTLVVTGNYGDRVTAVAVADLTNPPEWVLRRKVMTYPGTRGQNADDS